MANYGEAPRGDPLIGQILARKLYTFTFELHPELWGLIRTRQYYTARAWQEIFFMDPPSEEIPAEPGIYMFVVAPYCAHLKDHSYIIYVGKTKDLKRRYYEYLREQAGLGSSPRPDLVEYLSLLKGYLMFHYTLVPEAELTEAEDLLKDNLTPPANTQVPILGRLEAPIAV